MDDELIQPEIEILIRPGDAPAEFIARLFQAISDLHRAYTGVPLVIVRGEFQPDHPSSLNNTST